ncbi:DNA methyltransferase [Metallibacterium scheffleri]|uniref:Site-specific DNA-methyltransferase n=1 Tax=Metallibacterium scheffleri TaxID=993689 RepID=A0A4S3KJ32_9GAMM|nr:DNA methyltransferase [Metallibacterium scheffleri]THD08785.1 site-specific DNA-methyltransferase [Metallibacterium scheffleri]
MNRLYFGDNLHVLREHIADETVDLIYLDPPFNSKRDYNLLFKTPKGHESDAQITAFEDSWHWGEQAEREFNEILRQSNTDMAELMPALRSFLGENDMMAYLVMMANRLLELHRVLKPTGSLYLHCDPTASHYLKIVLDGVFGVENYRNEIIWRRSNPKSHITHNFPSCTDTILRYSKSSSCTYHQSYEQHDPGYVEKAYRYSDSGGRYRLLPLLNPNDNRPNLTYEFLGVTRVWRWTKQRMQESYDRGLVVQLKDGAVPQYKKYLEDSKGRTVTNLWTDIEQAAGSENLGYPTQKPLALLERIINASSNPGDIVLDPFCGCGTAVDAAQKLGRRWIGIDITHLAIALIEKRLKDRYPYLNRTKPEREAASTAGVAETPPDYMQTFEVIGTPEDLDGARDLALRDKYQFQWWACSLVNAQPYQGKKKGADGGIDGLIFFQDDKGIAKKIVVSVKGGDHVNVAMVRDLAHVVAREKAEIGLFVTLADPSKPMLIEAVKEGFYQSPLTQAQFPRIQILTIEALLNGTERARYPDLAQGGHTFKKAKRDQGSAQQKGLF